MVYILVYHLCIDIIHHIRHKLLLKSFLRHLHNTFHVHYSMVFVRMIKLLFGCFCRLYLTCKNRIRMR